MARTLPRCLLIEGYRDVGNVIGYYPELGHTLSIPHYLGNSDTLDTVEDGGLVIDKTPIPADRRVSALFEGPFLDPALSSGAGVTRIGNRYVGIVDYVFYWRGLGARIGSRNGDVIYWEGSESPPEPITIKMEDE